MVDQKIRDQYKATIGIECHVQLKTKTKLFAAVGNDATEAPANTLVSHICFGLPGALPYLNEEVLHLATRAAFALGTEPQLFSKFDRKHYFYPDLPKGYQITQYDEPIIADGFITFEVNGERKRIGITRAHLEEDAGKSSHAEGDDFSLVDLNRAGTPLLEIVSEPEMHNSAEAKAYARELYLRMRYADVSDANLFYGNMRFDVNVSVSKTEELGTRTETKNLNSFRSVEKAVDYEINRQIEQLEKGAKITQETRGWDDAKQRTFSQRSKENADDYRYMPDPDIPPIELDAKFVKSIKQEMPPMPDDWRVRLEKLGVDSLQVESLLEGELEDPNTAYLQNIEANLNKPETAKFLANWYVNTMIPLVREGNFKLNGDDQLGLVLAIYDLLQSNKLSSTKAKELFVELSSLDKLPADVLEYATKNGYVQMSDTSAIAAIVKKVLEDNPKAAEDIKSGEMKAIGFLVGQVMKQSAGKANPSIAQDLIKKELGI